MVTNEIKVLREFVFEFNPYFTKEMLEEMDYYDLIEEVKSIVEEM